jgi:hypothetical protein
MKLVLSRKGFDSSAGGIPSPILPDGRLISLPIPSREDDFTFADINIRDIDMAALLAGLSRQKLAINDRVHLDPDIDRSIGKRLPGWRPSLGQTGAAQTHLDGQGVGPGDVFIFFGWFREVEMHQGRWRYVPRAPDQHVMFGWLEIGAVIPVGQQRIAAIDAFPWSADHPHVANPCAYGDQNNSLYVAPPQSAINPKAQHGGGRFTQMADTLRLTSTGESRSMWSLPQWFCPNGRPALSYHGSPDRWTFKDDHVRLKSVGRGQEFVIDGDYYPELEDWAASIICNHS